VIEATMRNLFALLLLAPAAAFAGAYAIPNENARSLALSQADVAAQIGPEAAYQNASALAGQQGLAVSASLEMLYNRTSWSDPALGSASLRPKANFPPALAVGWGSKLPNGMPYGAGIAFLVPGGGSLFWPTGWAGSSRIQTVNQRVYLTQFSGGIQPLPFLKLGASLLWYRLVEELTQQIQFIDTTARLGLAGNAVTFGLSGEARVPQVPLTFGIDYRHQAPVNISGAAHFEGVPPTFATPPLVDQNVTEAVTVPNQLFLGAAYDVQPNLKVMGTFTLERWIAYRSDTYIGDKGLFITVPRNSSNAEVYRIGAEWTKVPFLTALTLRLGGLRSIGTQPTSTISPTLTDANSWAVSVGAGYELLSGLRVDLGYQFAFFDTVTATGVEAFAGTYDTKVHLLSAGVTWRPKL
jgi:hypothetical protein